MDATDIERAMGVADRRLRSLGVDGIYELMLRKFHVPVDKYICSHMAVVSEDSPYQDNYSGATKRRSDVFEFFDPDSNETRFFKITVSFDSWDTASWEAEYADAVEVHLVEKTISVWEEK